MKPFLKWAGGKGKLIPQLIDKLPDDFGYQSVTYIEPFIGGGAMLFYMLQHFPNIQKAVINDINSHLITTYRIIKERPNELICVLKQIQDEYRQKDKISQKDYYLTIREMFNNGDIDKVKESAYLIFLNKTCFNGLYRENSKGKFNVPFGRYDKPLICDEETILSDSKLLQKVIILNEDYENTACHIEGNTFFYFDPPYRPLSETSSFNSYSSTDFNDEEQIRLKKFCDYIAEKGCKFMLSNSDCKGKNPKDDFFDKLYENYEIHRVYAARAINANPLKRGKLTELLIRNYHSESFLTYAAEHKQEYNVLK